MEIKQPVRLVALDTEVFDRANFNYNSTAFQGLATLVENGQVNLYLTTVTYKELIDHLTKKAKKVVSAYRNFCNEIRIIQNSSKVLQLKNVSFEEETLIQELCDELNEFIEKMRIEVASIEGISPEVIFEKYFKTLPPFKEGKKKSEFPDAFAIAALELKAKALEKKIYAVSGDGDWKSCCEPSEYLIYVENIEKFLELLIKEQDTEKIELLYEILDENISDIEEQIKDSFPEKEFILDDEFNADWESEYIEIQVSSIEIADKTIVKIENYDDGENLAAIFELRINISFTASISYHSLEYMVWDEGDRIFVGEPTEEEIEQTITMPVEVELILYRDQNYKLCVNSIEIDLDPNNSIGTIVIEPAWSDSYY